MICCCTPAEAQSSDTTYLDVSEDPVATEATAHDFSAEVPMQEPVSYNKQLPTAVQWQQATSQKEFTYKDELEYKPSAVPEKQPDDPWLLKLLVRIFQFFASLPGKIMLFGVLALIVGYVLYRILSGEGGIFDRRNKKMGGDANNETTISEEDLLGSNWEERLRKALAAGDKRMAIRYSYMLLLQLLQARELIQYRQDKTNAAYYHELSGNAVHAPFRQLTRDYEYAWYGNFLPSAPAFEAYLQTFNGVKSTLGAS